MKDFNNSQLFKIKPKKLEGTVSIPPSKSCLHRAIICASLCKGESIIYNYVKCEDVDTTIKAMEVLGAKFSIDDENRKIKVSGMETLNEQGNHINICCNESGSTLRFLMPICHVLHNKVTFTGKGNLVNRPLEPYFHIFRENNISLNTVNKAKNLSFCDESEIITTNGQLKGGVYSIDGSVSSQFISGLLFTLPLLEEDSIIKIQGELQSKPYVDLTISILQKYGIVIESMEHNEFKIKGKQQYKSFDYVAEGDYSQAAFYICANGICNNVKCVGLEEHSFQGDSVCQSIINKLTHGKDKEIIIDGGDFPDIIPEIAVVASLRKGKTRIVNASRLRLKECDRLAAISTELSRIGANIKETCDGLEIIGVEEFTGGYVDSHKDHRIAMSLAIASTRCKEDLLLNNPWCVKKSYPNFWNDFISLGGEVLWEDSLEKK